VNSEWEYFIQAQQGDEMAWRVLVGRHQTRLTALALFITGSATAANDVVQETFVRAMGAKIRQYTGTVNGFLGTIAYRLALKEADRERRNVELKSLDLTDTEQSPLSNILKDERDRFVAEAIRGLNPEHRDVLILRFYGDYSYEEIARLINVPLGTVKSRIFNAVKSCRESLRQKGVLK
jgi:RNA polymerase sigma-70 factor (ECF subfamily)